MSDLTLWYHRKASDAQLWLYKNNLGKYLRSEKRPPLFDTIAKYRAIDAVINGQSDIVVTGDSIAHGGEIFTEDSTINGNRRIFNSAIGGDRPRWLISRTPQNVIIYRPQTVITHIGGNDLWGQKPVTDIASDIKEYFKLLRACGVKNVAWMEIVPLGYKPTEDWRKLNFERAAEVNRLIQASHSCDYLPLRKYLQDESGWVKPEFNSGDAVHINELGYRKGFIPCMTDYLSYIGV